jgi:hypothetical protein
LKSRQIPLHPPKGEREEFFIETIQKSSPPFEKGRTGGIYEPPFQKTKGIRKLQIVGKRAFWFEIFHVPFAFNQAF